MSKRILITGGSGGVGRNLTKLALAAGHQVGWLSRSQRDVKGVQSFLWDVESGVIQKEAVDFAQVIIHLAGAGVADKTWTAARRKEILESRTQTTNLLAKAFNKRKAKLDTYIGASAVGYYGMEVTNVEKTEESEAGSDFLAEVCVAWEKGHSLMRANTENYFISRIGIVLDDKTGALPKLKLPVQYYLGADLGTGKQWMPWIHMEDLCRFYLWAIDNPNKMGIYNIVAPELVNHEAFNNTLAQVLNTKVLLPRVPEFLLKFAMGDMVKIVTGGDKVVGTKLAAAGFSFNFGELDAALRNLL